MTEPDLVHVDPLGYEAKRQILRSYAAAYPRRFFVETGIYAGSCAAQTLTDLFERLYVVDIHENWVVQVARHGSGKIVGLHGDSAAVLPALLAGVLELDTPALFWLDAHANEAGEGAPPCPLLAELRAILSWPLGAQSVVLVDDVRQMGTVLDRPSLDDVLDLCRRGWAEVEILDDIIRCLPA